MQNATLTLCRLHGWDTLPSLVSQPSLVLLTVSDHHSAKTVRGLRATLHTHVQEKLYSNFRPTDSVEQGKVPGCMHSQWSLSL